MMFMDKEKDEVLCRCIETYGADAQIDMMIEEMSELTKALLKFRRDKGEHTIVLRNSVIDEIADVKIMCRQMEILFKAENEVNNRISFKVRRQQKRLDESK